ncbi:MAG: hypothetical protein EOO89_09320, partial [Pedobacter sp.]
MKFIKIIIFIGLTCCIFKAQAQKEIYPEAEAIAVRAKQALNAGNVSTANSLIKLSIDLYPNYGVIDYITEMAELSDVSGANRIMEALKEKIKSMPDKMILIPDYIDPFEGDIYDQPLNLTEKNRALFNYLELFYDINVNHANRAYILSSMKAMQEPVIQKKTGAADDDREYSTQLLFKVKTAKFEKNFEMAHHILDSLASTLNIKDHRISLLYDQGEYQKAFDLWQTLPKKEELKKHERAWPFKMSAGLGDKKALEYFDNLKAFDKDDLLFFILAQFYFKQKDYNDALQNLEAAEARRIGGVYFTGAPISLWDLHKAYGDIYTGLKQYSKARDHYNLSLLYYPGFKDAAEALENMEQIAGIETNTDRSAPIIVLTEPAPSRGIKVIAAGASFMVRGIATDPSGIKEVLVNGSKMFVQPSGEFWGDITVVTGLNKLIIQATDMASNKGEKAFEVQVSISAAPSEIIAATDYKGQNYCLLIAAQNYKDIEITSLDKPIGDAIKLKKVLRESYGFLPENILSLFNPTTTDIKRQLLEISTKLKPEDNLLIFYAGHGITKDAKGYWLMTDAIYRDPSTWFP